MIDWSKLGRGTEHPLVSDIAEEWLSLLSTGANEQRCHEHLRKHATLFLADGLNTYIAVSKLKLGSSLELDFAIPSENHSAGLYWELIELKGPGDSPYTRGGKPSAKLVEASQQIRDWKRWLIDSRGEAQRLFSLWSVRTQRQPNFRFTIVIGTRENSEQWLDKRNQFALENGISVRSYDYLSDRIRQRLFLDRVMLCNASWDRDNPVLGNALANPFIQAYSDSDWKKLLSIPKVGGPTFSRVLAAKFWKRGTRIRLWLMPSCKKLRPNRPMQPTHFPLRLRLRSKRAADGWRSSALRADERVASCALRVSGAQRRRAPRSSRHRAKRAATAHS